MNIAQLWNLLPNILSSRHSQEKKRKWIPFFPRIYIFILEIVSKPGYKIYTTERKREREGSEKGVGRAVVNTNIWLNSGWNFALGPCDSLCASQKQYCAICARWHDIVLRPFHYPTLEPPHLVPSSSLSPPWSSLFSSSHFSPILFPRFPFSWKACERNLVNS